MRLILEILQYLPLSTFARICKRIIARSCKMSMTPGFLSEVLCQFETLCAIQIPERYEISHPERSFVSIFLRIVAPGMCQIYRHHNYRGLPEVFYASATVADSSACVEACFNDNKCRSVWFDTSNSMCMRYDDTYGNQIIYAQGSDYYRLSPCDERDPKGMWKRLPHKICTVFFCSVYDVVMVPVVCKSMWCI